jgi:hypothetical protein
VSVFIVATVVFGVGVILGAAGIALLWRIWEAVRKDAATVARTKAMIARSQRWLP